MMTSHARRNFVKLAGLGGVVLRSGLPGWAAAARREAIAQDFYFVQLSDTHLGFNDPAINPDAEGTLPTSVAAVNALPGNAGLRYLHRRPDALHRRSGGTPHAPGAFPRYRCRTQSAGREVHAR